MPAERIEPWRTGLALQFDFGEDTPWTLYNDYGAALNFLPLWRNPPIGVGTQPAYPYAVEINEYFGDQEGHRRYLANLFSTGVVARGYSRRVNVAGIEKSPSNPWGDLAAAPDAAPVLSLYRGHWDTGKISEADRYPFPIGLSQPIAANGTQNTLIDWATIPQGNRNQIPLWLHVTPVDNITATAPSQALAIVPLSVFVTRNIIAGGLPNNLAVGAMWRPANEIPPLFVPSDARTVVAQRGPDGEPTLRLNYHFRPA